jgi:lambda family phage portal protein
MLKRLKDLFNAAGEPTKVPEQIVISKSTIDRNIKNAGALLEGGGITTMGRSIYPGSDFGGQNDDFQGEWRSLDSWIRQDLYRVRLRSRWLEHSNPWMKAFATSAVSNIVGPEGFHAQTKIFNAPGEINAGQRDLYAEDQIKKARAKFEKAKNFTTHKRLDAQGVDALIVNRLIFDGEFIAIKEKGFKNECGFAWKIIDPDYFDHNNNRTLENGNVIKMGVELDAENKFPVAYWFTYRRPNDYFLNYNAFSPQRYYRVQAEDVIHIFPQTMDSEQVRGFPLVFAVMVNLYREGKFEDAALVNAVTGALRTTVYEKDYPEGITGGDDYDDLMEKDPGVLLDRMNAGGAIELPFGIRAKTLETQYPNADLGPFIKTMLTSVAAAMGQTYMGFTGDVTGANFSSLRAGKDDEREKWKVWQNFLIRSWKEVEMEEWLFQAILRGQVNLPMSKFDKWNCTNFVGRRWTGVNPLQDAQQNTIDLNNRVTSISQIIRERTQRDPEEVLKEIAADEALMKELGIQRVLPSGSLMEIDPSDEEEEEEETPTPTAEPAKPVTPAKPAAKKKKN